jgi:hypothetical protein
MTRTPPEFSSLRSRFVSPPTLEFANSGRSGQSTHGSSRTASSRRVLAVPRISCGNEWGIGVPPISTVAVVRDTHNCHVERQVERRPQDGRCNSGSSRHGARLEGGAAPVNAFTKTVAAVAANLGLLVTATNASSSPWTRLPDTDGQRHGQTKVEKRPCGPEPESH